MSATHGGAHIPGAKQRINTLMALRGVRATKLFTNL
jgi:hypothetical protein